MATQLTVGGRMGAIARAREWLTRGAVFLDTETTGLRSQDQVCEVAVVTADGTVLFESLIQPTVPMGEKARQIHGITDEQLASAPTFPVVHAQLCAVLAGKVVVTYNADFDSRLLAQTCLAFDLSAPACEYVCGMRLYAAYYANRDGGQSHKLVDAAGQAGIRWGRNIHRAADDARVLRELVAFMGRPR